jgi:hypothetical protein
MTVCRLHIQSHTWVKESHGLFDYDLKDVMTVAEHTHSHISILRDNLSVSFCFDDENDEKLIARIVNSGDQSWWIYH